MDCARENSTDPLKAEHEVKHHRSALLV